MASLNGTFVLNADTLRVGTQSHCTVEMDGISEITKCFVSKEPVNTKLMLDGIQWRQISALSF